MSEADLNKIEGKSTFWKALNAINFYKTFGVSPLALDAQEKVISKVGGLISVYEATKKSPNRLISHNLEKYSELAKGFGFNLGKPKEESSA